MSAAAIAMGLCLVVIGLGLWVLVLEERLADLRRHLDWMQRELNAARVREYESRFRPQPRLRLVKS